MTSTVTKPPFTERFLHHVERHGNRLPSPTLLFFYFCIGIMLVSAIAAAFGLRATLPGSGEEVVARNLLGGEGVRWMLTSTVNNFVTFAPVGTVLVAMLGLGIAEHSGLLRVALTRLVLAAPRGALTFIVVFSGMLSSLTADAGYVVLIPLAGLLFSVAGRPPLAGIAAAFGGVAAGYSANILIGPLDVVLAGLSTEAVQLVAADYAVDAAGNYYFMIVSTVLLSAVGTWVTERWVTPWLSRQEGEDEQTDDALPSVTDAERRGLWAVLWVTLGFWSLMALAVIPEWGVLRGSAESVLQSAFLQGIVVLIALYAGIAGVVFGKISGHYRRAGEAVSGMEHAMGTMATYIVLMFFAAQFVNYFAWSQLGVIMAINGAEVLGRLSLPPALLLVLFVSLAGFLNLFVGSATAKWALVGPVFVPMLYLLGISPEASQMAYRIGDSVTNVITPLMPYFGVVVAFAQHYRKNLGIGTLVAMMLPYSVAFWLVWSLLLALWVSFGWPMGPGAPVLVP